MRFTKGLHIGQSAATLWLRSLQKMSTEPISVDLSDNIWDLKPENQSNIFGN